MGRGRRGIGMNLRCVWQTLRNVRMSMLLQSLS